MAQGLQVNVFVLLKAYHAFSAGAAPVVLEDLNKVVLAFKQIVHHANSLAA